MTYHDYDWKDMFKNGTLKTHQMFYLHDHKGITVLQKLLV